MSAGGQATMLQRLPDWPERLAELCAARRDMPLVWGQNDCCTFAADAVVAVTGDDLLGTLRGQWATALQAQRMLASEGGLLAAVQRRLGAPLPSLLQVGRGDVVLISAGGHHGLVVCMGDRLVGPGDQRQQQWPLHGQQPDSAVMPLHAWGVGHAGRS